MAGETVRNVRRYPDDWQTTTVLIPAIGTGSAIDKKIPLFSFDRDVVIDAAWVVIPGTSSDNVALGTNVAMTLGKYNDTDVVAGGVTGTAVALSDELVIGGTVNSVLNDTAIAKKPFVINTSHNIVTAGNVVGVTWTSSASIGSAGVHMETYALTIRFRTKNSFGAVGADELKKTA